MFGNSSYRGRTPRLRWLVVQHVAFRAGGGVTSHHVPNAWFGEDPARTLCIVTKLAPHAADVEVERGIPAHILHAPHVRQNGVGYERAAGIDRQVFQQPVVVATSYIRSCHAERMYEVATTRVLHDYYRRAA